MVLGCGVWERESLFCVGRKKFFCIEFLSVFLTFHLVKRYCSYDFFGVCLGESVSSVLWLFDSLPVYSFSAFCFFSL